MIKKIDKYIVKQFLQTFLFGILIFALVFIVIDLMEKLDDFIDQSVSFDVAIEYYLVFIPEIIKLITPVAILLSALFTTGKMSSLNEVTAMRSAGISYYRFLSPFLIVAFLVSIFAVYFGSYIVPMAQKHKIFIEQSYLKKGIVRDHSNIYFQDSPTRIVTISYYNLKKNSAERVGIQEFDPANTTIMRKRIDAFNMSYDSTHSSWIMKKAIVRTFSDSSSTMLKLDTLILSDLNFSPSDVIKKQMKPEEMNLTELAEYAKDNLKSGNDPTRILIEYHSRFAFGFASFVVVLFGLTVSPNNRKGGVALQFGINISITFVYLIFMKISQAFGKNGIVEPLLTAWLANLIFLVFGIINLLRANK